MEPPLRSWFLGQLFELPVPESDLGEQLLQLLEALRRQGLAAPGGVAEAADLLADDWFSAPARRSFRSAPRRRASSSRSSHALPDAPDLTAAGGQLGAQLHHAAAHRLELGSLKASRPARPGITQPFQLGACLHAVLGDAAV